MLTQSFYVTWNQKPNHQSALPSFSFWNNEYWPVFMLKLWEQWAKSAWQKVKGEIMASSQAWGQEEEEEEGLPPHALLIFPQWVSQKWQHTPVWLTPSLSLFWWVGNNLIAKSLKLHVNPSRCETQLLCVLLYMWYHHAVSSYYRFSSSDFVLPSCLHTYTSGVTNVITCLKTQAVTMPMMLNDVVLHYSSNLGNHTVTCSRC